MGIEDDTPMIGFNNGSRGVQGRQKVSLGKGSRGLSDLHAGHALGDQVGMEPSMRLPGIRYSIGTPPCTYRMAMASRIVKIHVQIRG